MKECENCEGRCGWHLTPEGEYHATDDVMGSVYERCPECYGSGFDKDSIRLSDDTDRELFVAGCKLIWKATGLEYPGAISNLKSRDVMRRRYEIYTEFVRRFLGEETQFEVLT